MKNNLVLVVLLALALGGCVSAGPGSDFDEDGLRDTLEDKNESLRYDLGETDFTRPDTDGDGVCDGLPPKPLDSCKGCEDCNNNGFWEPCLNETDPLNDDTDNDGVNDGDDPAPLGALQVDCSRGEVKLPYGASLPPGKGFPPAPTPSPTPTPLPLPELTPTPTA